MFKALGHQTRLKIVEILATQGGTCVCELVDRLGFDQSTISKHLALMRSVGLVVGSKDGLRVTYELSMPCVYQFMQCLERVDRGFACSSPCAASQKSSSGSPSTK
ncbi:MAG: metalloregulator ArsR/SmtB family transcription factor [Bacillota bacterium]|nr:metalloregulator ArsR/SmtB family transcription factor [Bacillota bacterium]